MTWDHVTIERHDAVALVRFNRPDCRNALSLALIGELTAAAKQVAGDDDIRAVVLAGGGGVFCAGLDLKDAAILFNKEQEKDTARRAIAMFNTVQTLQDQTFAIDRCRVPVIAALSGYVIGGGKHQAHTLS